MVTTVWPGPTARYPQRARDVDTTARAHRQAFLAQQAVDVVTASASLTVTASSTRRAREIGGEPRDADALGDRAGPGGLQLAVARVVAEAAALSGSASTVTPALRLRNCATPPSVPPVPQEATKASFRQPCWRRQISGPVVATWKWLATLSNWLVQ